MGENGKERERVEGAGTGRRSRLAMLRDLGLLACCSAGCCWRRCRVEGFGVDADLQCWLLLDEAVTVRR